MLYNYNGVSLDLSERVPEKIDFTCSPEFVARAYKAWSDYVENNENSDIETMLFIMMRIAFDGCDTKFEKK